MQFRIAVPSGEKRRERRGREREKYVRRKAKSKWVGLYRDVLAPSLANL